jgi:hypothetical protein
MGYMACSQRYVTAVGMCVLPSALVGVIIRSRSIYQSVDI